MRREFRIINFVDNNYSSDIPGDTCCFPFSLGSIKKLIEEQIPGVYVKSIEIENNIVRDFASGYFIHPDKQVKFFAVPH
jgi:hypothetical protein